MTPPTEPARRAAEKIIKSHDDAVDAKYGDGDQGADVYFDSTQAAKIIDREFEPVKEALQSVVEWWDDHKDDRVECGGESSPRFYNPPQFVIKARKTLLLLENPQIQPTNQGASNAGPDTITTDRTNSTQRGSGNRGDCQREP